MQEFYAPLFDKINDVSSQAVARFCMPGHSGKADGALYASAPFDLTELDGLDNMLAPAGVIAQAERAAARAYRSLHALFFTAGATSAMHTAIAVAKPKGEIYAVGRLHKSFYGGCALLGARIVQFDDIDAFVASDVYGGTAFFTYVDYFGNVVNDSAIVDFCRSREIASVADSAHGAHFAFSRLLPKLTKADVAIYGMHKTMPVYGGGAVLTCNDGGYADEAAYWRQFVHTTSPSYLVMASMDNARALFERDGENFYRDILDARRAFDAADLGVFRTLRNKDFSRLVLIADGFDASGFVAFCAKRGIMAEAAIGDRAVFIITPYNVGKLPLVADAARRYRPHERIVPPPRRKRERRCHDGEIEFVSPEDCEGRVCAADIGLYPPGTPWIMRGDVFTEEDAEFLKANAHMLFGLVNGRVVVVK